jgi:hypothetical protein
MFRRHILFHQGEPRYHLKADIFTKLLHMIEVLLPTDAQENCFKSSIKIYI